MNRSQERLTKALQYIEDHIDRTVCLDGIADAARRLRQTEHPILRIAPDSGFGSNEAFTSAFRREHGISPRTFRQNTQLTIALQGTLTMTVTEDIQLDPTVETRPGFLAVGCAGEFHPGATEDIGQLWQRFAPQKGSIQHRVGTDSFGICVPDVERDTGDDDRFTYMASVAVDRLDDIPQGMTGIEIPERTYAVFAYDGGIGPELGQTMASIFGGWLPDSKYEADGADFEHYTDEFDPMTGTGRFYICVPIREV